MAQETVPASAPASTPPDTPGVIHVDGVKGPMMHKYRIVSAGLDAFDEYRHLAPAVTQLHFRLRPNRDNPNEAAPGQAPSLRIVGDDESEAITVPFAADGTVVIPRSQRMLDQNADIIVNRKKSEHRGAPEVRTPGVPATMRRLGDLRLQCRVFSAMIKEGIGFFWRTTANAFIGTDWCGNPKTRLQTDPQTAGVLTDAYIAHGNRSAAIKFSKRSYTAPLADTSWPDDALIYLTMRPDTVAGNAAP